MTSTKWRASDVLPCNIGFTTAQQPSNAPTYYSTGMQPHTQSSYSHQGIRTTFFYDIHGNEVDEYGSFIGDEHDSDNYIENNEASTEDLHIEDNINYIPRQNVEFIIAPFEPNLLFSKYPFI